MVMLKKVTILICLNNITSFVLGSIIYYYLESIQIAWIEIYLILKTKCFRISTWLFIPNEKNYETLKFELKELNLQLSLLLDKGISDRISTNMA